MLLSGQLRTTHFILCTQHYIHFRLVYQRGNSPCSSPYLRCPRVYGQCFYTVLTEHLPTTTIILFGFSCLSLQQWQIEFFASRTIFFCLCRFNHIPGWFSFSINTKIRDNWDRPTNLAAERDCQVENNNRIFGTWTHRITTHLSYWILCFRLSMTIGGLFICKQSNQTMRNVLSWASITRNGFRWRALPLFAMNWWGCDVDSLEQ